MDILSLFTSSRNDLAPSGNQSIAIRRELQTNTAEVLK